MVNPSQTSRYRRFFTGKPHLSEQSLAYFTDVDHRGHEALVVVVPGSGQLVGVARYIRVPGQPDRAEVACCGGGWTCRRRSSRSC